MSDPLDFQNQTSAVDMSPGLSGIKSLYLVLIWIKTLFSKLFKMDHFSVFLVCILSFEYFPTIHTRNIVRNI